MTRIFCILTGVFFFIAVLMSAGHSRVVNAHWKPSPKGFVVSFVPGANWDPSKHHDKQKGIGEHIAFVKKLYVEGKLFLSASDRNTHQKTLIIHAQSLEELKAMIDANPSVKDQTLSYKAQAVLVNMQKRLEAPHSH